MCGLNLAYICHTQSRSSLMSNSVSFTPSECMYAWKFEFFLFEKKRKLTSHHQSSIFHARLASNVCAVILNWPVIHTAWDGIVVVEIIFLQKCINFFVFIQCSIAVRRDFCWFPNMEELKVNTHEKNNKWVNHRKVIVGCGKHFRGSFCTRLMPTLFSFVSGGGALILLRQVLNDY